MPRHTTLELDDHALAEVRRFYDLLELDDAIVTLIRTGPSVEQVWVDPDHARFIVTGPEGWDIGGWSASEFFGERSRIVEVIDGIPFGFESADAAASFSDKRLTFAGGVYGLSSRLTPDRADL